MAAPSVLAAPLVSAGDTSLRQDIQLLADHRIIAGPVTTWPLAWGPIMQQVRAREQDASLPSDVAAAIARVRSRAQWESRTGSLVYSAEVGGADTPTRIRSFSDSPRESVEVSGGISWTGNRLTVTLKGQTADRDNGDTDVRADGSMIGIAVGNYTLSLNALDRWWGPGWDGSLILSNNARPIPAISLNRNFTDPFESKWLRWIGPWDLSLLMGQLESDRHIPDARFFGMRFNFRPSPSLELGLSRTAQWCGESRPCDAGAFSDLLLGHDNAGDAGIDLENEPGNQLAGIDFRWSQSLSGLRTAVYGQLIGEDEAGGFPSRYLGLFGVEASGMWHKRWSWRWFGEFAGTSCQFYESSERFNCAYNHGIYETGYRYLGRAIGHGADNDARLVSTGLMLVDAEEIQWRVLARVGELNRGGAIDTRNTVAPSPQDILSLDLSHTRTFRYGVIDIGLGFEQVKFASDNNRGEARIYMQWRSAY